MKNRRTCIVCKKTVRRNSGVTRGANVIHVQCVALLRSTQPPAQIADFKAAQANDRD